MKNPDPVAEALPYVTVGFVRFTTTLMVTVGMLLKNAVTEAPALPPLYDGIWDPFFDRLAALEDRLAKRADSNEGPEVAEALAAVKDAIREFGSIVSARLHSRDEDIWTAASTLWEIFFPKGFDVVTDKQHDVVGWVQLNMHRWKTEFAGNIRTVYAERERNNLETALQDYAKAAGRYYVSPAPEEVEKTALALLNECRAALRGVMLELAHLVKRQPEYKDIVMGMLRPLAELTEKVRSDKQASSKEAEKSVEVARLNVETGSKTGDGKEAEGSKAENGSKDSKEVLEKIEETEASEARSGAGTEAKRAAQKRANEDHRGRFHEPCKANPSWGTKTSGTMQASMTRVTELDSS